MALTHDAEDRQASKGVLERQQLGPTSTSSPAIGVDRTQVTPDFQGCAASPLGASDRHCREQDAVARADPPSPEGQAARVTRR